MYYDILFRYIFRSTFSKNENRAVFKTKYCIIYKTINPSSIPFKTGKKSFSRLEMRAQKFGIQTPETTSAKKLARAIRFGMSSTSSSPSSVPVTSTEVLKKRAERFGTAIAPILKKTELDEKLKLRQERFGVVTTISKANLEEKRRLRAERFKLQAA